MLRRHALIPLATALTLTVSLAGAGTSRADQFTDQLNAKNQQKQYLNGLMSQLKWAISDSQNKEADLARVIDALNGAIATTNGQITDAQARLDDITRQLAAAKDQLKQTQDQLAADKTQLSQMVVVTYKAGVDSTVINNLLSSSSFNDFMQQFLNAQKLSDGEHQAVMTVTGDERRVVELVATVADEQRQQQAALVNLQQVLADQQQELQGRQQAEQALAAAQAQDQERLAEAERAAAEVAAQIKAIQAAQAAAYSAGLGSGHFIWPEVGPITQGFGCTPFVFEPYDPNCPTLHFHSGIDIGAPYGTPIHASAAGQVFEFSTSYGYGNYIIMNNGGGWTTLYGHLSGFAVGNGVSVAQGQVIGYEGSTGNSTGPHLHFEIDSNGNPVNPLKYLP